MPIYGLGLPCLQVLLAQRSFLADRTIDPTFCTLCRLSVVCLSVYVSSVVLVQKLGKAPERIMFIFGNIRIWHLFDKYFPASGGLSSRAEALVPVVA